MLKSVKGGSGSADHAISVYGGIGQQTFNPTFGNLIKMNGGRKGGDHTKRHTYRHKYGGTPFTTSKNIVKGGKKKRHTLKNKKVKRGGACGCTGGNKQP